MVRLTKRTFGLLAFVFLGLTACSTPSNSGNNTSPINATKTPVKKAANPPINGTTLTADMSDEQILKVFGIDIAKAEAKKSKGPDGYTTAYTVGAQSVYITHSVVSGDSVMASGPIHGSWSLGGGNS